MKNYNKEQVKELLNIGSSFYDGVKYCEEFHFDFYNALDPEIECLLYEKTTLSEALEMFEQLTISDGFYSTWFGEHFTDIEQYEELVKSSDRIINIIKSETLTECIIINYGDEQTLIVDNIFDAEHTINKFQNSINNMIETLIIVQGQINYYNQTIEELQEEDIDLFDLAIKFYNIEQEEGFKISHKLWISTQEQGLDEIRFELTNLIRNCIDEVKQIKEAEKFAINLTNSLSIKIDSNKAKRVKI